MFYIFCVIAIMHIFNNAQAESYTTSSNGFRYKVKAAEKVLFLFEIPEIYRFYIDEHDTVYLINSKKERYTARASKIYVVEKLNRLRSILQYDVFFTPYIPIATSLSTAEELNDMAIILAIELYKLKNIKTQAMKVYVYQRMMMQLIDPDFRIKFIKDNQNDVLFFEFTDQFTVVLRNLQGVVYPISHTILSLINFLKYFTEKIRYDCELPGKYPILSEDYSAQELNDWILNLTLDLIVRFEIDNDQRKLALHNFLIKNVMEGKLLSKADIKQFLHYHG